MEHVSLFCGTLLLTRFMVVAKSGLASMCSVVWLLQQEARPTAPAPDDDLVVQNAACTLGELRRSRDRLLLEHFVMERQETNPLCDSER